MIFKFRILRCLAGKADQTMVELKKEKAEKFKSTTILAVRRDGRVAVAGDGQVTLGDTVMKHRARKVRKIYNGKIIVGFAGATADALSLFERFEAKLDKHQGNLTRAVVELAKDWRTDKVLRRLEALLLVTDKDNTFLLSGTGDVIEPDDGVLAIGSGGPYAHAAARALLDHSELPAATICRIALEIAGRLCIYSNTEIVVEEL